MTDNLDLASLTTTQLAIVIGAIVVFHGIVGAIIGEKYKKPIDGLIWGLFLLEVGWLLFWLMNKDNNKRLCEACRMKVPKEATKCRHCGSELKAVI